jgi:predicted Zn-dependent peptidase
MNKNSFRLENGLTVMNVNRSKGFSGCLSINIGHVSEPSLGIAGLFEKTLLLQVSGVIPNFGGTMTAYTASSEGDLDKVMKSLSNIFNATKVTQAYVTRAQNWISEETRKNALKPVRQMKLLYKHTAFGADLVRPTEEFLHKLNSYTTEDVRSFANAYYTAKNTVLVIAGPKSAMPQIKELAEKYFGNIPAGEKLPVKKGSFYTGGYGRIDVVDDDTSIMFGWDASGLTIDDSPAANVMMSMFLNRLEGAYLKEMPQAKVKVDFKIAGYYGIRTMRATVSSPTAGAKELADVFVSVVNRICDVPASDVAMESAKNWAMAEKLDKYEKSDNFALETAWQLIGRGSMYDTTNRITSIHEKTAEDVRDVATRMFRGSRVTYIVAADAEIADYSYREIMEKINCTHLLKDDE